MQAAMLYSFSYYKTIIDSHLDHTHLYRNFFSEDCVCFLMDLLNTFYDCLVSFLFEGGEASYTVAKVKDLPKLHRAVWKCDMKKVKTATKGIKKNDLNAFDKSHR